MESGLPRGAFAILSSSMESHLTLEPAGAFADLCGAAAGILPGDLDAAGPRAERAQRSLFEAREEGKAGFLDLPLHTAIARDCRAAVEPMLGRCETLVVVGIGGSALGARALLSALTPPWRELAAPRRDGPPRVVILDTADPSVVVPLLETLSPETTWWNVVSKSGKTLEVLAAYGLLRPHLQDTLGPRWRDRVIVTTDPGEGPLREEAKRERLPSLEVAPDVGGRFSVLSAVGLLPAAAAGLDIEALQRGAASAAAGYASADPGRNEALRLALLLVLLAEKKGRRHHVLLPYRQGLLDAGFWWQQLWAESLGKDGRGFDATAAAGSGAQHSLLQLWMEGPADKAFVIVEVDDPGTDRVLPPPGPPGAAYLVRRTLGDAQASLAAGTRASLVAAGRPVLTLRLPTLTAESLGAFLQLWLTTTALSGYLLGVDPFGQPGVEEGKRNASSLLGREEDRERRGRVEDLLGRLRARR